MEDLNKSQLILLAILVSFVTSIATSTLTIAKLDEGAPTVTQTITRVVERTIQTVTPGQTNTVVKEVPVVVTEEELIVKVVDEASGAVGTLTFGTTDNPPVLGLGFVLAGGSYVVTSGEILPGGAVKRTGPYNLTLEDGTKVTAELAGISTDQKIAALKVTKVGEDEDNKNILSTLLTSTPTLTGIKLAAGDPAVGQTVVALGSVLPDTSPISVGIVSSLVMSGNSTSTASIKTNAANKDNIGGPLLSIQGQAMALSIAPGSAIPSRLIQTLIDSVK